MSREEKPSLIRRMFKARKRIAFFLIVVIVLGLLGYRYFVSKKGEEIKTARVYKGTVQEELILSGEIKAEEHANLSFLSSGELDFVRVKEGQEVRRGEVLARLDPTNAYQTFLTAEADLRRYQASLEKTYDEVKGHEKDESFEQREARTIAETNKDKAYRAYIIAQKNLANLTLLAPFDGIVTAITHPFSGINTSLTESQIEIVNPKTVYFSVSADQTEVTKLNVGQGVNIVLDSFPQEQLKGEVSFIGYTPKVGEIGTIYKVKVRFIEGVDTQKIRIGMSGDAKFVLSEVENVLYVPPQFVKSDRNGRYLNLERKNNKVYVEVGVEGQDRIEIKSEKLKEGQLVFD